MRGGYAIADEPEASRLAHLTVRPSMPLLALMLGGAWIAWPWFALNAYAMGSPTRRRERHAEARLVERGVDALQIEEREGHDAVRLGHPRVLGEDAAQRLEGAARVAELELPGRDLHPALVLRVHHPSTRDQKSPRPTRIITRTISEPISTIRPLRTAPPKCSYTAKVRDCSVWMTYPPPSLNTITPITR